MQHGRHGLAGTRHAKSWLLHGGTPQFGVGGTVVLVAVGEKVAVGTSVSVLDGEAVGVSVGVSVAVLVTVGTGVTV